MKVTPFLGFVLLLVVSPTFSYPSSLLDLLMKDIASNPAEDPDLEKFLASNIKNDDVVILFEDLDDSDIDEAINTARKLLEADNEPESLLDQLFGYRTTKAPDSFFDQVKRYFVREPESIFDVMRKYWDKKIEDMRKYVPKDIFDKKK